MSYRFAYPNGGTGVYDVDPAMMSGGYPDVYDDRRRQRSYSPESFSSESESSDDYEYRGRMITRETRCPRDVVRCQTPPPIIKRVVERAPTPEAPIMERVIIRPQAQEIVERVIEQPRTPPLRIIQKEMQEEAPPPIVRTRVIKVDRPLLSGYSQPGSPYANSCHGLPSFSNGALGNGNGYRTHSMLGSVGRPAAFQNPYDNNPNFSSASSFEYAQPPPMPQTMMMMPPSQQSQSLGFMQQQQQQQQPVQQQVMYRPAQQMIPQSMPSPYMYPAPRQGMPFGYHPMMQQQGRMIPSGMPMMTGGHTFAPPATNFPSQQPPMFNPLAQQLVY